MFHQTNNFYLLAGKPGLTLGSKEWNNPNVCANFSLPLSKEYKMASQTLEQNMQLSMIPLPLSSMCYITKMIGLQVVEELAIKCSLVSLHTIGKSVLELLANDLKNGKISNRIANLSRELIKNKERFNAYELLHGIQLTAAKIDLGRYVVYNRFSGPLATTADISFDKDTV